MISAPARAAEWTRRASARRASPCRARQPSLGTEINESIISARSDISLLTAGTEACYYKASFPFGPASTSEILLSHLDPASRDQGDAEARGWRAQTRFSTAAASEGRGGATARGEEKEEASGEGQGGGEPKAPGRESRDVGAGAGRARPRRGGAGRRPLLLPGAAGIGEPRRVLA